jgi:P pilus assembly chaperone PapD
MIFYRDKLSIFLASTFAALTMVGPVQGSGMTPETSVVLINSADGEGVISVKNTDTEAMLLFTSLENLPDDPENFVLVTPPVARVEPGKQQLVRFILQSESPIITQRLKRVTFEGIPQVDPSKPSKLGVSIRQNLPVLITPGDLPEKADPWKLLKWSLSETKLTVKNDSPYVVRLNLALDLLPAVTRLSLRHPYVLPGASEVIQLPESVRGQDVTRVRIYPVSVYGYQVKPYEAVLIR